MLRLLQWIFLGHVHKWKTVSAGDLEARGDDRINLRGKRYIQQCETCGMVVKRDLI